MRPFAFFPAFPSVVLGKLMALQGLSTSQGKIEGCEARPTSCLGCGPALSARRIVVA